MERYRIRPDSAVYFLTYSVMEWLPIFVDEQTCGIVTDSLAFCHREKSAEVRLPARESLSQGIGAASGGVAVFFGGLLSFRRDCGM
jgi:hypothetical protein